MLDTLLDRDETSCIEEASIGASTVTVFLNAIKQFCGEFIDVLGDGVTYEGRHLYEAVVHRQGADNDNSTKPVIIIEAGQESGSESVMMALYVIEQLVACEELNDMIEKVRWVILPCTNPDGLEYSKQEIIAWKKNLRPAGDEMSLGVDISRNFDTQWGSCPKINSVFSQTFPGPAPASENETIFIKQVLSKYKNDAKIYLSLKRDGHSIGYPYANTKGNPPNSVQLIKIAGEVTTRVNQRTGGVHLFVNNSIFELEGKKPHCGHSVDYAYDQGIHLAFEMRVFLGHDKRIMTKFQTLPRGYEASLRNGYFSAIRELYNVITNERKYGRIL
nr:M14 metal carboxypeptidase-like 19 [Antheraea pernyi]